MKFSLQHLFGNKGAAICGLVGAYCAITAEASAATTPPPIALASYASPGLEHVFVWSWSNQSCITQFVHSSSGWVHNCVQIQIGAGHTGPAKGTKIFGYYSSGDNQDHLFYQSSEGNIHEAYWTDNPGANGAVTDTDLTATLHTYVGHGSVDKYAGNQIFVNPSTLTGFFEGNLNHIFYSDATGVIRELYHYSGGWSTGHASRAANAVNGRGLSSQWDGGCEHIYYTATDGGLWEDYDCGSWQSHELSGPSGAITPPITGGQVPSGYLTSYDISGTQGIWGIQSDRTELRYVQYVNQWESLEVSVPALGDPSSAVISVNFNPYYVGSDGLIYDFSTSLQSLYGGPAVLRTASGTQLSEITGFLDTASYSHIFYVGTDGDLHEYYQAPNQTTWSMSQLTSGYRYQ